MNNHFDFTIGNSFDELSTLCKQLHGLLEERHIPSKKCYVVMLALEEMITNTIKYGYDDNNAHQIKVIIDFAGAIKLTIEDDGHQFDPLQSSLDAQSATIEECQIGGMGIHLTKSMVNSMSYRRNNDLNILTILV
ncbi:MAG: ATP-binding protein [Victivallaceae bacterium]|nr:ATP-binding protein [Victivallaceae bacterium]